MCNSREVTNCNSRERIAIFERTDCRIRGNELQSERTSCPIRGNELLIRENGLHNYLWLFWKSPCPFRAFVLTTYDFAMFIGFVQVYRRHSAGISVTRMKAIREGRWYILILIEVLVPESLFVDKNRLVIKMTSPENIQVNVAGAMQQQNQMSIPQGVMVPQGLPPGLAYLGALDEVRIHQHLDVLEGNISISYIPTTGT